MAAARGNPGPTGSEEIFGRLREDVDFLGRALGQVLQEIEGRELFDLVERVRGLTKRLRAKPGDGEPRRELDEILAGLSVAQAERLVRAFAVYFQLINLAEEIHRVRVNRQWAAGGDGAGPRAESIAAAIQELKDDGWTRAAAEELVRDLDIRPTLTAHPTEVKRYTVRLKLERIASALRRLREQELSPGDRQKLEAEILAEISTLWRTRELVVAKPTVLDEVKSALYYYRRSLLDAVPRIQGDLERALDDCYGAVSGRQAAVLSPVVRFRSWIGGDRDGNPFVTPEITAETYRLQARVAVERHVADIDTMVQRLSQWRRRTPPTAALAELERQVEELSARFGPSGRFPGEPYRRRLFFVHRDLMEEKARLTAEDRAPGGEAIPSTTSPDYLAPLLFLDETLHESGDERAAVTFVRPVVHRAAAFGLYLAALDLREHSARHEAAVADLLRAGGITERYGELTEEERVVLLAAEIERATTLQAPDATSLAPETVKALEFLRVFRRTQERWGDAATGSYVISMTRSASDVLEVLLLACSAGVYEIDATPLFETVADLEAAPEILSRLLAIPVYRAWVERRGLQEVMIGYSDSNKDAGFLAANWALFEAQESVARVCREAGVPLRIFHGRGTSIGRGGGPAGQAILAQPPGSLDGRMRMTEQGEALDDRYSDPDLAHRHLEQVVWAFLLSSARDAGGTRSGPPAAYRQAMARASVAAKDRYRGLLEANGFLDFYHAVTPIEEISRLEIGSRPARRRGEPSLDNLRAIPWVFSWTQCRANLPGWFGLGTGLDRVEDELLAEMYRRWPFFHTLLDLAQMSLAKADLGIFSGYLSLVPDAGLRRRFGEIIRREYDRTAAAICRATGKGLLADDSTLARSIGLRDPYVDPISYLQVELLRRLRALPAGGAPDATTPDMSNAENEDLDSTVKLSLLGIAAGMRNTG